MIRTLIFLLAIGGFAAFQATYTLHEVEQGILTEFGKPVGDPIVEPGLHFKMPWQTVNRFDKRWLEWTGGGNEIPTAEKTYIGIEAYARWRIADPLKFFTSVSRERDAQSRLDDILESEIRNVIADHPLIEAVRTSNRDFQTTADPTPSAASNMPTSKTDAPLDAKAKAKAHGSRNNFSIVLGREKLARMVLDRAKKAMPNYGIELVDVQFRRVNYKKGVKEKVFERMISERQRIAARYRAQGEGQRAEILGKRDRDLQAIESEAYRKVEEIKGTADAEAAQIYADAYGKDEDLYRLVKSLETLERGLDKNSTLVLSTEAEALAPLVSSRRRR